MKITKLELIKVKPRWMFLKMYTDTDIYGLGEPILEGHANAVEAVVKEFEDYLIGKDPMMIEHHLQALYRGGFYRGGGHKKFSASADAFRHFQAHDFLSRAQPQRAGRGDCFTAVTGRVLRADHRCGHPRHLRPRGGSGGALRGTRDPRDLGTGGLCHDHGTDPVGTSHGKIYL